MSKTKWLTEGKRTIETKKTDTQNYPLLLVKYSIFSITL